jgi:hypothetical protein
LVETINGYPLVKIIQKIGDKIAKAKFVTTWSIITISEQEIGSIDKSKQATMHISVNLGFGTKTQ